MTYQDAIAALENYVNNGVAIPGGLQGLVESLSHHVADTTSTLLYNGYLGLGNGIAAWQAARAIADNSGGKIAIVDNTDAMRLLKHERPPAPQNRSTQTTSVNPKPLNTSRRYFGSASRLQ